MPYVFEKKEVAKKLIEDHTKKTHGATNRPIDYINYAKRYERINKKLL